MPNHEQVRFVEVVWAGLRRGLHRPAARAQRVIRQALASIEMG